MKSKCTYSNISSWFSSQTILFMVSFMVSLSINGQIYNVNYANLNFGGAGVTITPKVGSGMNVNDIVLYENVITVGGQQIDGIITTVSLVNGTFTIYDYTGTSYNNLTRWFSPQLNFNSGGGWVEFNIKFILGGSYDNATNTGNPVILQNFVVNSYDIDGNGTTGTNQYCDFSEFNSSELGNPTNLEYMYDPVTGLTRYRSTSSANTVNAADEKNRVRWTYLFMSELNLKLGGEGSGAAYYFLDFSQAANFTSSMILESPVLDLDTETVGIDHDTTYTGSAVAFTEGITNIIYSLPTIDNLKISFLTSIILDGAQETFLFNGSGGMQIPLNFVNAQSISNFTIGGITYSVAASVSGGRSQLVFAKNDASPINLSDAESLLDSIDYINFDSTPTIADRTFSVTTQDGAFESGIADFNIIYPVSLPAELSSFDLEYDNGQVLIIWVTSTEHENDFFVIEKTKEGNNWAQVVQVEGAGTSLIPLNYNYTDRNPFSGVSYYRLKQVDFDGNAQYSEIKSVNYESDLIRMFTNDESVILSMPDNWSGDIAVLNILGQLISKSSVENEYSQVYSFYMNGLIRGKYWIKCISQTGDIQVFSFVK